jgi:SPP1 family predicted phage head-tail adaptor
MLKAGSINKRVVIERQVTGSPAADEYGAPIYTWETLATVWAAVEPISGREFWAQQQVQSEITARIRIRYRNDVASGMRVVYGSRYYAIKSVIDPQEYHQELQLMCSEGVRDA